MRALKVEYHKDGMIQRVVWRNDKYAIASVHASADSPAVGYEVWVIQSAGERVIASATVEAGEYTPSAASWGVKGWTVANYAVACSKVAELMARPDPKNPVDTGRGNG